MIITGKLYITIYFCYTKYHVHTRHEACTNVLVLKSALSTALEGTLKHLSGSSTCAPFIKSAHEP